MAKEKIFKKANSRGITLVALVVTIVVLLILAGITINILFSDNGIIKRAEDAAEKVRNAENKTNEALEDLIAQMESKLPNGGNGGSSVVELSTVNKTDHKTLKAKDSIGNIVTVPKGFVVVNPSETVQDGIVISDKEGDDLNNTAGGNQFVWIPVGTVYRTAEDTTPANIKLGRYNFNTSTGEPVEVQLAADYEAETSLIPNDWSGYTDKENKQAVTKELKTASDGKVDNANHLNDLNATAKNLGEFINSVEKNGGYYLARYEASYGSGYNASGADDTAKYGGAKPQSKESTATSFNASTVGSLWNNITQLNASKVCRNMYTDADNVGVESDLVNSYAWDTAIVYIQEMDTRGANFANKKYTDVGSKTEAVKTGTNGDDKFCNIYDMVANLREWTTEYSTGASSSFAYPCVNRGGRYNNSNFYTAGRSNYGATHSYNNFGFRPLLYVK